MYRLLLITIAAVVFALPGVYSVATSAAAAMPDTPAATPQVVPGVDAGSTVWPAVEPSPSPQGRPPVTTVSGVDERWHRTTVTLHLTVTDPGSGVAYTTYRVGNGPWEKGTTIKVEAPKDHSNDGAVTVRFYSVGTDGTVYVLSGSVYVTTVKPDGTTASVLVPAGSAYNPAIGGQPTPITVPEASNLEQVVANMGYPVYSAPTDYAIDNTQVWVSPTKP